MQELQEKWVRSLDQEDPLEEGMANHSNIIVWRIPWTEEPGGKKKELKKKPDKTERLTPPWTHRDLYFQSPKLMVQVSVSLTPSFKWQFSWLSLTHPIPWFNHLWPKRLYYIQLIACSLYSSHTAFPLPTSPFPPPDHHMCWKVFLPSSSFFYSWFSQRNFPWTPFSIRSSNYMFSVSPLYLSFSYSAEFWLCIFLFTCLLSVSPIRLYMQRLCLLQMTLNISCPEAFLV